MLAFVQLACKTFHVARRDAQAIHARVHLQVEGNALAALPGAFLGKDASSGAIKWLELLATMDHGRQIVFEKARLFAGPETCQHKHGLPDAGFAHGDAFFRAGDTEPVRSGFFECLGHLRAAMAIAVAFDDAEDFAGRPALLFWRIHELANRAKIFGQGAEVNFRPYRTPCFFQGTLLFARHGPSEKISLRHPAALSRRPHWMPPERQPPQSARGVPAEHGE